MSEPVVRPLLPEDAEAASWSARSTFDELDRRTGGHVAEPTALSVARGTDRVAHLQRTDPDGAWVAELDGRVVGVALALRRGPLWFLSLLTVDPSLQSRGTGRALLDAALSCYGDSAAGWILASRDPRAVRRYALAGFAPEPAYEVRGTVDRSLLPAVPSVRTGSYAADADLVEEVGRLQRGAGYGPDLEVFERWNTALLVTDGPRGRGFAVVGEGGVKLVAATAPAAAQDLLWAALAEVGSSVDVECVTAGQQWAVEVLLAARLPLVVGGSTCHRGKLGPFSPYLPYGPYG